MARERSVPGLDLHAVEIAEQPGERVATARRLGDEREALARGHHLRAFRVGEPEVAHGGRHALGDLELARLARVHLVVERRAGVHDEPDDHVLLGAKELEDGLSRASEGEPVDATQVVARSVRAVLQELGARPPATRGVVAAASGPRANAQPPT